MKKFLFTLAALLMAGSLCAEEYFFVDDFEVSQEMLAQTAAKDRRVQVPVKAHFDYYVNSWQVDFGGVGLDDNVLPEGITMRADGASGPGMTIHYMKNNGSETDVNLEVGVAQNNTRYIGTVGVINGYWYPEGLDPDEDDPVAYGSIKWDPGDYDCMFYVTFQFAQEFTGCELRVVTQPSSGYDTRGEVCPKNQVNERILHITVEGGVTPPPPADLTGQIEVTEPTEEGIVYVNYTGEEAVTITVNGEAYNGEAIQLVEGVNTIDVVVSAEGYNDLTGTFIVNWTAPTPPPTPVTPTPEITVDENYNIIVNAEEGAEVHVYVDGAEVTMPYTFEQGEQDATYTITATAQLPGMEISEIASYTVTIPGTGGGSGDEHDQGYWLVMVNQFGGLEWYQLFQGDNGDYTTTVALNYDLYGGFDPETEERPVVDYYFVIDGKTYGALEEEVATVLGTAMDNPLGLDGGFYTLEVGFNYNLGVAIGTDGEYYVYAAKATTTGVDELINGKTVASKRFFNLAGQEMQEVNGVTIVVTTYTDGTTTATKVMK